MKKTWMIIIITLLVLTVVFFTIKFVISSKSISIKDAEKIALKETIGGKVISSTVDKGVFYNNYDFVIIKSNMKYDIEVDGRTEKVTGVESEVLNIDFNQVKLSSSQAEDIAVKRVGPGKVVKNKLDLDDGKWIYEINVTYKKGIYEVDIDASTGEILNYEED